MQPTQETQIFLPGESHGQRSLAELRLFNTLSLFDRTEVTSHAQRHNMKMNAFHQFCKEQQLLQI